jgi:hypothetical protein
MTSVTLNKMTKCVSVCRAYQGGDQTPPKIYGPLQKFQAPDG